MCNLLRNSVLFLILSLAFEAKAQELKCNIQIVSEQVQGTNKKVFETLQNALYEFVNNRSWTNNVFSNEERIECNMLINIKEYSGNDFKGTLQVQARRPIFGSSYNSVLFNYLDQNFQFSYVEFEPLQFTETSYTSGLTSLMAFYAYLMIGLDYDSFSNKGGTEYLRKAEAIVNNAQNATEKGWRPYDVSSNKGRYWLIQNLMDDKYAPVREFNYRYHRQGLDRMSEKPTEGRDEIAESLKLLQQVYRSRPDSYMHLLQVEIDAKSDEWINIFSESLTDEKTRAVQILKEIDPTNSIKYQKIMQ